MRSAAGPVEWLTFPAPDDPDRQFRVNVSFLLSNYECIFGRGCPGSLNKYPSADHGCCERGVTFIDEDDFEHVEEMVGQLTAEDADNIDHIRNRGWFLASRAGKPYKTRKIGGLCIFGNRTGGAAGKSGCAFHPLAARQGKHHTETKPFICWSVPLNFRQEDPEEPGGRETTIVSAFTADAWSKVMFIDGWKDGLALIKREKLTDFEVVWVDDKNDIHMTDGIAKTLQKVKDPTPELLVGVERPRFPMPGQRVNRGLPMIGQIIEQRFPDHVPTTE